MWEIFSKNKAEVGRGGEKIIVKFLKKKKYKILETNYRTAFGEADIIAQKGEYLVFVEVKTRSSELFGSPAEAVDYKKQQRYIKMAEYYIACHEKYSALYVRFDVAEVLSGEVNYIENAFTCD